MAGVITWNRLRSWLRSGRERPGDQSLPRARPQHGGDAADLATKLNSLLDEAQKSTFANRNELTHDQKLGLQADFERVRSYLTNDFDRGGCRVWRSSRRGSTLSGARTH